MMNGEAKSSRAAWPLLLLTTLQIMSWASTTGRPLPLPRHLGQADQGTQRSNWVEERWAGRFPISKGSMEMGPAEAGELKGISAVGSTPPSCHNRCGGCFPCAAIQVPTTTDRVGVQYTNYEPEGWKCKCGSSFYNP
ncbi:hypothetical protein Taro_037954 [Colocasia esculenta]|uniref:Epidermal patterning factor-like protein n=1 Tax=Colocasia esculenta TaxID=4460 RepID=A0A843WKS6_COLES|nr:hypothetical protein [Colocasia esculenta]